MEKENKDIREIKIEKIVLSVGGTAEELEKGCKLLERLTGEKSYKTKARKRIPAFNVKPGLEVGTKITIRKNIKPLLIRLLAAVTNQLKIKQIEENNFSFGILEYIEVPDMEYQRDLGMLGFNVTVVFSRKGKRIENRKIKRSKQGAKQKISKEEIIKFMKENYNVEVKYDSK